MRLPKGYIKYDELDVTANWKGLVVIIVSICIGLLMIVAIFKAYALIHPGSNYKSLSNGTTYIYSLLIGILVAFLHEAIHWISFYKTSRAKPRCGFANYIFPCVRLAENEYVPINGAKWTSILPCIVLTILGMIGIIFVPNSAVLAAFLCIIFIAVSVGAAVGDIYSFAWLRKRPKNFWIGGSGNKTISYGPK